MAGGGGISNQDTSSGDNGLDLDGNKYPDLIVGSPFSGQAVYLRSRPVVRVNADVYLDRVQSGLADHRNDSKIIVIRSES